MAVSQAVFPEQANYSNKSVKGEISLDEINIFQELTEDGNFYDTRTVEVFQQFVSNNISQIIDKTQGWVRLRDMVLQTNVSFNFAGSFANSAFALGPSFIPLGQWVQPEFALLQPIIRVTIKLGENNQAIIREEMCMADALRLCTLDCQLSIKDKYAVAHLGVPFSVGYFNITDLTQTGGTYSNGTYAITAKGPWPNECDSSYDEWRYSIRYVGSANPVVAMAIPLFMLNSFFQQDAFLPEGINFNIEIEYSNTAHNIAYNNTVLSTNQGTNIQYTAFQVTYNGSWSMQYRANKLKKELDNKIRNLWVTRPLQYNYESFQPVTILGDGITTKFDVELAINQQRPLQLWFRCQTNTSAYSTKATTSSGTTTAGFPYPLIGFGNATAPGLRINRVQLFINGEMKYQYDFSDTGLIGMPFDKATLESSLAFHNQYKQMNRDNYVFSSPMSYVWGQPFVLTINPGDYLNTGYIATDTGSVTARMIVELGFLDNLPLPTDHKVVIYKKYPIQLQIDSSKNVQLIQVIYFLKKLFIFLFHHLAELQT